MAMHEQRLSKLRAHVGDARDELHALPAEDRTAYESELARLEEVVADADSVLGAADARLVSSRAFASVQAAACAIANDPRAALQAPDAHTDALVDAVALLPVTRKEIERRVLLAAEAVHASTAERLDALQTAVDAAAERVRRLESDVERSSAQARELDEHQARQREAFADGERGRAAAFEAQLEDFRSALDHARGEAADEVAAHVAEIRRLEHESSNLVGAIGLEATADFYARHGRRQQRAAEILRGLAVLGALGAVAIALAGALVADPTVESLVSGLFAALLVAALAAYLAHQSARHRTLEERAAAVQLELAAFGPFIEPLSAERRDEERVAMARRLFGTVEIHGEPPAAGKRAHLSRASSSHPASDRALAAANGAGPNGGHTH